MSPCIHVKNSSKGRNMGSYGCTFSVLYRRVNLLFTVVITIRILPVDHNTYIPRILPMFGFVILLNLRQSNS